MVVDVSRHLFVFSFVPFLHCHPAKTNATTHQTCILSPSHMAAWRLFAAATRKDAKTTARKRSKTLLCRVPLSRATKRKVGKVKESTGHCIFHLNMSIYALSSCGNTQPRYRFGLPFVASLLSLFFPLSFMEMVSPACTSYNVNRL